MNVFWVITHQLVLYHLYTSWKVLSKYLAANMIFICVLDTWHKHGELLQLSTSGLHQRVSILVRYNSLEKSLRKIILVSKVLMSQLMKSHGPYRDLAGHVEWCQMMSKRKQKITDSDKNLKEPSHFTPNSVPADKFGIVMSILHI